MTKSKIKEIKKSTFFKKFSWENFWDRVNQVKEENSISNNDIAYILDVSKQAVSKWFINRPKLQVITLIKFLSFLMNYKSINWILFGENEPLTNKLLNDKGEKQKLPPDSINSLKELVLELRGRIADKEELLLLYKEQVKELEKENRRLKRELKKYGGL